MARYSYSVINKFGKKEKGVIESLNENDAIEVLQDKGMYIVEIEDEGTSYESIKKCKTKLSEIALFSRQISTMLSSGINIVTSIEVLEDQGEDKQFKRVLKEVRKKVEQGTTLSTAMKENTSAFPGLLCTMVEAGEMTGDTDSVFEKMADYYDKENKMRQKIVNATIYPSILVIVSLLAISGLMIFAIPQFLSIFEEMQIPLPFITKLVIGSGSVMKSYWYVIALFILIVIVGYKMYYASENGGVIIDKIKIKIPAIGEILLNAAIARFSRTLSSLLEAGVSIIPAIEITKKVVLNKYMIRSMDNIISSMRTGESLSDNLKNIDIMPKIFSVMVKTGEDSGKVDYMLLKAAELYENEVDLRVSRINTIIEPVIIVCLAVVLGVIMAAVMLPMFTLYGSM